MCAIAEKRSSGEALFYVDPSGRCASHSACFFQPTTFNSIGGALMFEGLFQPMHLLVIFGIALLVFGPKKLPELGKGIGEGIRGFKSAMKEEEKPAEKP